MKNFEKYVYLRDLLDRVSSHDEFFNEIGHDPKRYHIEGWARIDYDRLYERIKGGIHYEHKTK